MGPQPRKCEYILHEVMKQVDRIRDHNKALREMTLTELEDIGLMIWSIANAVDFAVDPKGSMGQLSEEIDDRREGY
eukprot:765084-Hanusia_phi.AAC.1